MTSQSSSGQKRIQISHNKYGSKSKFDAVVLAVAHAEFRHGFIELQNKNRACCMT
jgi:hypothetical protein